MPDLRSSSPDAPLARVRVWDLPTRLFHWALMLSVAGMLGTAWGPPEMMAWHVRFAHLVFGLLAFRLVWGVVGGRWSRFSSFVYAPSTLLAYLQRRPTPGAHTEVGHSPLGALSVFGLLFMLGLQLFTGLVIDDEISYTGPLNRLVSVETVEWATRWHRGWGGWILSALIVLHVLAIQVYAWRKKDLLGPMLQGDKLLPAGTPASADGFSQRQLAVVVAALAAWITWLVFRQP